MEDLVGLAERQRAAQAAGRRRRRRMSPYAVRRHSLARRAISRHVTGTAPRAIGPLAQALGQVVVVEGGRAPVALVAPPRDAQRRRHGVELLGVVRQQVGPAVGPVSHRGPLAPVVDVDGQRRRAQGRSRRMRHAACSTSGR